MQRNRHLTRIIASGTVALVAIGTGLVLAAGATAGGKGGGVAVETPAVINGTAMTTAADMADGKMYDSLVAIVADSGDPYNTQFCGGTLIAPKWVVTAAHCVWKDTNADDTDDTVKGAGEMDVMVGQADLNAAGWTSSTLSGVFSHPDYNPPAGNTDDDIALLRLTTAIPANVAMPMPLVQAADDAMWDPNSPAAIGGWGNTSAFENAYPNVARKAAVPLKADSACNGSNPPGYGSSYVNAKMLCGGTLDGDGASNNSTTGVDTCQGDSGGPLYVEGGSERRLAGIVSFGIGCAEQHYGVYAEVDFYRGWVGTTIGANPADGGGAGDTLPTTGGCGSMDNGCTGITLTDGSCGGLGNPRNIKVKSRTFDSVTFQWQAPLCGTPPKGYDIWHLKNGDYLLKLRTGPTSRVGTARGLKPGTRYVFNIDSYCCGTGPSSYEFSTGLNRAVTTVNDLVKPSRAGRPFGFANTRTSITLRWPRATDNHKVARYIVYRRAASGRFVKIGQTATLFPQFRNAGLRPCRSYVYSVRAQDVKGNVSASYSVPRSLVTRC